MLLDAAELGRALRLQQQTYGLLKWLNQHLRNGSLSFSVVHRATGGAAAAEEWLVRNRAHIPPALAPADSERHEFAHLLVSYLQTSFELPAGKVTERIADCHCYCDYCSYVIALHRLVPRQPEGRDRRSAHELKRLFLESLVADLGYPLEKPVEDAVFANKASSLDLSCTTYAHHLIRRTQFASQGAALLVLWRDVAWEDGRKPKKKFELSAAHVLACEERLRRTIGDVIGTLSTNGV